MEGTFSLHHDSSAVLGSGNECDNDAGISQLT